MSWKSGCAAIAALVVAFGLSLDAQKRGGLVGDLLEDVGQVETKVVGLAKAIPAAAYDWRPGDGARSVRETLLHVAADNYFIPAAMDVAPPKESGIDGKDFKTTMAFEKRALAREQVVAEVEKSFAFLKQSVGAVQDSTLDAPLEIFGQKGTNRKMWLAATTHLHEHLGQLIAYARSNKVTPPWSK